MTDDELTHAARQGDRRALEALARRYSRILHTYVAGVVADPQDAAELAQKALLGAMRLDRFRGECSFRTWAFAVCKRTLIDHGRQARRTPETVPLDSLTDAEAPAEWDPCPVEAGRIRAALRDAVERIPLVYRGAVCLRLAGYSQQEVADALEVDYHTARSRCSRGGAVLRPALKARLMVQL